MAAIRTLGKAGLLALVIVTTLSLQAEAQNQNDTFTGTPRWAVAAIVMLGILLGLYVLSCCLVPLCKCLCNKGGDQCQGGCSFGK